MNGAAIAGGTGIAFKLVQALVPALVRALVAVGVYLALTIPVAVFPDTNFPRIVVGVDNGVFPIDQMMVTVTRPIEEAVNTVPGLDHLWSVTSRGTAEIDLFFSWDVNMYQTLELVNAALAEYIADTGARGFGRALKPVAAFAAVALVFGYGQYRLSHPPYENGRLKVSLIQGNIEQFHKWDAQYQKDIFDTYTRMTLEAAKTKQEFAAR